jgi:hypothetical protein
MTLLARVSATLDAWGVPSALIGAAALAAAGVARSSFDVDLLVTDGRVLDGKRWGAIGWSDVAVDVRRGDADDPLAGVVRVESGNERPVDVIVGRHSWQARAIERARRAPGSPPVVLPRDLVLLKLYAAGTQDLWDVRELLRLLGDRLVVEVEEDLRTLPIPMREAWTRART